LQTRHELSSVKRRFLWLIKQCPPRPRSQFSSPLGKLADWAIYFACDDSFLFLSFLMIARRKIFSGSTGPIFAIFSPNESVLGADD